MAWIDYLLIFAGVKLPSRAGVRKAALLAIALLLAAMAGVASVDLRGELVRPPVVRFDRFDGGPAAQPVRIEPAPAELPALPAAPDLVAPPIGLASAPPAGDDVRVKLSHYWPPLGGPNCARFVAGVCVSRTASGERWQDWTGTGAACVPEWPFGTILTLPGGEHFTCVDRGGAIVTGADGVPWVDLMVREPPVPYGSTVTVLIVWPAAAE